VIFCLFSRPRQCPKRRNAMNEPFAGSHPPATITVVLEPEGGMREMPRPKTVAQLCDRLDVRQGSALVIRDGELLTPDRRIETGDTIIVRSVVSRG
ncbi:MAG: hypothetical protein LIP28_05880, partial [Deltaproteobacteria bacterium]|nr:hypothetical protein [Deltaproteobacteria bacterium]